MPTEQEYRNAAYRLKHDEGVLEVDETAKVSTSDEFAKVSMSDEEVEDGAYVQAWVWIDREDVTEEDG